MNGTVKHLGAHLHCLGAEDLGRTSTMDATTASESRIDVLHAVR